jgi:hypothetical protein
MKIHTLPCPIHPDETVGYPSAPKRCAECFRVCRRDRTARGQDVIKIGTRYKFAQWYAHSRGLEFSLSLYQYTRLIESPCVYAHKKQQGITIGLDRKDSAEGYTVENSAPCCYRHNMLKSDVLTYGQTLQTVKRYKIDCGNKNKKGTGRLSGTKVTSAVAPCVTPSVTMSDAPEVTTPEMITSVT